MLAIIAIIVVIFCQFYFGWIKKEQTLPSALINTSPYLAIFLAYVARHFIRTPWLLDLERLGEIKKSSDDLEALSVQLDNLTSELTRPKLTIKKVSVTAIGESDEDDQE